MIKPLDNMVLLKIKNEEEKTKSGIIITNNTKEKSQFAKIIEVGKLDNDMLKKDQIVIFNKFSGIEINYENEEYLIVKVEDILAIIE